MVRKELQQNLVDIGFGCGRDPQNDDTGMRSRWITQNVAEVLVICQ